MSGAFAAGWLDLREPADAAAVSRPLLERLAGWWRAGGGRRRVVDLGAGTGANLRRTAAWLGPGQDWALAERDPALVAAGERRLAGQAVPWRYRELDLDADLERLAEPRPDLIAASALLDLASAAWLERLARLRAATGAALLVQLSFDGRVGWRPEDPLDGEVQALLLRHQAGDKGLGGPALGPAATDALQRLLDGGPGELRVARSDWRLGAGEAALQDELLRGHAAAAAELAPGRTAELGAWAERRLAARPRPGAGVRVGHLDLLFLPEER